MTNPDRVAAVALVADLQGRTPSLGILLLRDIRRVFIDTEGVDKMATETLLSALHDLPESPWSDLRGKPLDPRELSRRLGRYSTTANPLKPKRLRVADKTLRGYEAADFTDAWSRYLAPDTSATSATSATPALLTLDAVADVADAILPTSPAPTCRCGKPTLRTGGLCPDCAAALQRHVQVGGRS